MGMRTVNRFDGRRFIEKAEPPKKLPVSEARSSLDALLAPPGNPDPNQPTMTAEQLTGGATFPPNAPGSATPDPNAVAQEAAGAADQKPRGQEVPDLDGMTKEELGVFIAKNGGEAPASNALKAEFVEAAKAAHAKAQKPPQA